MLIFFLCLRYCIVYRYLLLAFSCLKYGRLYIEIMMPKRLTHGDVSSGVGSLKDICDLTKLRPMLNGSQTQTSIKHNVLDSQN